MGRIPLDAASDDFPLQGGDFLFVLAEQGEIAVIRQPEALQQGVDAVAGGGLPSVFHAGNGHGFANALAQLLLGQPQLQPPLLHVFSQKYFSHILYLSS